MQASIAASGYDAWGNPTTATTYNAWGQRTVNGAAVSCVAPAPSAARTTTTTYDSVFHTFPTQVSPPTVNGVTLTEQALYDYRMGTLLRVTGPNTTGTLPNCSQTNYAIPSTNTYVIPANEESTCAQYDLFGRMIKLVKPGDSTALPTLLAAYADTEQPFRYRIDRREGTSTANVRVMQQFYDGLGRQIQTKAERANSAQNIVVDTRYDGLGHVTAQSQPRYVTENATTFVQYTNPGSGALFNPTTTTYDGLGRPKRITTPDTHWTEHQYGLAGGMAYHDVVDANRHRTQTRTDVLGRLREVYEISGDCGTGSYSWASCTAPYTTGWAVYATTTYAYSSLDQLTTVTDTAGNVTSLSYDSLGRKLTTNDRDMGLWSYSYDANGNLLTQTGAKSQTLWFGYDALNRLTQKRRTNASGTLLASYTYDAGISGKGQRTGMSVPSGASTGWVYDARGRTTQATYTVPGLTGTRLFQWSYDSADRLLTQTYPYNVLGNITSKPGNGVYTYPASGASSVRPHTPSAVNGASYTYDGNGNLTGGGGRTYTWTIDNLPLSVSQVSGSESYSYDAGGARVKKVAGSVTTVYLAGLWEEVAGGATRVYYPFSGQTIAVRDSATNTVSYLHGDHLGSASVATNVSGGVASSQEFDAWGTVRAGGITQTTINFTGQRLDGTGLLYYHARYYDPVLGQFVRAGRPHPCRRPASHTQFLLRIKYRIDGNGEPCE